MLAKLLYGRKRLSIKTLKFLTCPITDAVAAAAMDPGVEYVDQNPAQTATLRSYFPETWLWELVPTGYD